MLVIISLSDRRNIKARKVSMDGTLQGTGPILIVSISSLWLE